MQRSGILSLTGDRSRCRTLIHIFNRVAGNFQRHQVQTQHDRSHVKAILRHLAQRAHELHDGLAVEPVRAYKDAVQLLQGRGPARGVSDHSP